MMAAEIERRVYEHNDEDDESLHRWTPVQYLEDTAP
jgi:hypothetical protein